VLLYTCDESPDAEYSVFEFLGSVASAKSPIKLVGKPESALTQFVPPSVLLNREGASRTHPVVVQ
jgi:hypothetical protein